MRPIRPSQILSAAGMPAFLVTRPIHVEYLTGLRISSGAVLCTPRAWTLYTDGRYREAAEEALSTAPEGRVPMQVRESAHMSVALRSLAQCGCEAEEVTLQQFRSWKKKFPSTKFIQKSDVLGGFRRGKDADELRCFRRAQRITRELLRRVPSLLRRPLTERDVAWQLRAWAYELGADELAFDPIVAFGTHTSRPHHHPTYRTLRKGHIVQIDVGARYRGYCADQSAVYFTAEPTAQQRRVFAAVCEAKDAAVAAVRAGATTHELDAIARRILAREGLEKYFTHALGHGVGLEIHEGPTLSAKAPEQRLLPGEIVTIEPGVYIPGRFGMRVEEEVVVR